MPYSLWRLRIVRDKTLNHWTCRTSPLNTPLQLRPSVPCPLPRRLTCLDCISGLLWLPVGSQWGVRVKNYIKVFMLALEPQLSPSTHTGSVSTRLPQSSQCPLAKCPSSPWVALHSTLSTSILHSHRPSPYRPGEEKKQLLLPQGMAGFLSASFPQLPQFVKVSFIKLFRHYPCVLAQSAFCQDPDWYTETESVNQINSPLGEINS